MTNKKVSIKWLFFTRKKGGETAFGKNISFAIHSVALRSQRIFGRDRTPWQIYVKLRFFVQFVEGRVHAPEPWMWRTRARETQEFTENPLKSWIVTLLQAQCLRLLKRNGNKFQAFFFSFLPRMHFKWRFCFARCCCCLSATVDKWKDFFWQKN